MNPKRTLLFGALFAALALSSLPIQAQTVTAEAVAKSPKELTLLNSGSSTQFGTATLTSTGTNVTANDTVTIGSITYTFKASVTTTANEVFIGASAAATLVNLAHAVNLTGTPGTNYGSLTTINTKASAGTPTATTILFTAKAAGDDVVSTEVAATLSFASTIFTGATSVKLDTDKAPAFRTTLTRSVATVIDIQKHKAGRRFVLALKQDGTGSRTVSWDSDVVWSGGTAPTLTTTASRTDLIQFYDTGSKYLGSTVALNYTE